MACALIVIGILALFQLADQNEWARNVLGGIIFVGLIAFLLWLH